MANPTILLKAHAIGSPDALLALAVEPSIRLGVEIDSMKTIAACHTLDEVRSRCDSAYWFLPEEVNSQPILSDIACNSFPVSITQVALHRHNDRSVVRFYGKSVNGSDEVCTDFIPFRCSGNEFTLRTNEAVASLNDIPQ